jgi:Tol biopolymer transport system component
MRTQAPRWLAATLLCFALAVVVSSPALAAVAPNGKITYVVNMGFPDYTTDIWVMDADGSNQTDITNTPAVSEYGPIWSPDGTKIAYVGGDGYTSSVWVMNADGTGQFKLSAFTGTEFGPTWSADSSKIALVRYVPVVVMSIQFDIFVVALDSSSDVSPIPTMTNSSPPSRRTETESPSLVFAKAEPLPRGRS